MIVLCVVSCVLCVVYCVKMCGSSFVFELTPELNKQAFAKKDANIKQDPIKNK